LRRKSQSPNRKAQFSLSKPRFRPKQEASEAGTVFVFGRSVPLPSPNLPLAPPPPPHHLPPPPLPAPC